MDVHFFLQLLSFVTQGTSNVNGKLLMANKRTGSAADIIDYRDESATIP